MQRRRIVAAIAVVLVALVVYWWWSGRPIFLPFGSNAFVETVTISEITPLPAEEVTETVPVDNAPERNRPLEDPIQAPAGGRYVRIDLKRYDSVPQSVGGREVADDDSWAITFALYRPGDPQGDGAREYICMEPYGAATGELRRPVIGHGFGGENYVGQPLIDSAQAGHNLFWTFVAPPDNQDDLLGEYVYEVRLYPTARWVSDVRQELGDPIVLRRGALIVVEDAVNPSETADGDAD